MRRVLGVVWWWATQCAAIKVACVGDSITRGDKKSRWSSYPEILGERLADAGHEVQGFGEGGTTAQTGTGDAYVDTSTYLEAIEMDADVYVAMLGTNDAKEDLWDADDYVEDYEDFLASLPGSQIFVLAPPPYIAYEDQWGDVDDSPINNELGDIVAAIAARKGYTFVDVYAAFLALGDDIDDYYVDDDGIHPNEDGNAVIADAVADAVVDTYAPSTQKPTFPPTYAPTRTPSTAAPTYAPTTRTPTAAPATLAPTLAPSSSFASTTSMPTTPSPSVAPTRSPSAASSNAPTRAATELPTLPPTVLPTPSPTVLSSASSTTLSPTISPTLAPTRSPAMAPTMAPTMLLADTTPSPTAQSIPWQLAVATLEGAAAATFGDAETAAFEAAVLASGASRVEVRAVSDTARRRLAAIDDRIDVDFAFVGDEAQLQLAASDGTFDAALADHAADTALDEASLLSLTFDSSTLAPTSTTAPGATSSSTSSPDGAQFIIILLCAAVGVLLVVFSVVLLRRRWQQQRRVEAEAGIYNKDPELQSDAYLAHEDSKVDLGEETKNGATLGIAVGDAALLDDAANVLDIADVDVEEDDESFQVGHYDVGSDHDV